FFFCVCGCVCLPPPCIIVEVEAVPHVSLPSSCASCCADVLPCALLLFCSSSTHTHKSICTVLCRNALGDGGASNCVSRAEMARPLRVCLRWDHGVIVWMRVGRFLHLVGCRLTRLHDARLM
ncbi:trans-sialidase, partial [Trypanosoma cruzi]